jgi:hypothetical protein
LAGWTAGLTWGVSSIISYPDLALRWPYLSLNRFSGLFNHLINILKAIPSAMMGISEKATNHQAQSAELLITWAGSSGGAIGIGVGLTTVGVKSAPEGVAGGGGTKAPTCSGVNPVLKGREAYQAVCAELWI